MCFIAVVSAEIGSWLVNSGKKVCEDEIIVRVSGPEQMDISVIDLPGIIHAGDGQEETRTLINRYGG